MLLIFHKVNYETSNVSKELWFNGIWPAFTNSEGISLNYFETVSKEIIWGL